MKTKTTFKNLSTAVITLLLLMGFNAKAQTYVYNESVDSGLFIDGGAKVANPLPSDPVNSSANCAQSGTGWNKIEFFPTYTPVSGDKLYFSIYNPNNVTSAQIKFNYTSGSTEVWGGNVNYNVGATSGWVEYSLDLSDHVGNQINKIWLYLAGGEANFAYVDNVYFGKSSVLTPPVQTYVYNESLDSGLFIDGGAKVANPLPSDPVNSSANCAQSGTVWNKIEFFPTYTPVSGDKLYFSVYNPNNLTSAQIKFNYTSGSTEVWGGNVNYNVGAISGWIEYSLDLTDHVGNQINKIWLYLAGGEANFAYVDNVYFAKASTLGTKMFAKIDNQVYVSKDGKIQFGKEQTNSQLSVFDISGRLILEEKINGFEGAKTLNNKGIYIVSVKSDLGVSAQKIIF